MNECKKSPRRTKVSRAAPSDDSQEGLSGQYVRVGPFVQIDWGWSIAEAGDEDLAWLVAQKVKRRSK